MELVKNNLEASKIISQLKQRMNFSDQSMHVQPDIPPTCSECNDTGRVYFTEEKFGRSYQMQKTCICRLEIIRRKKLLAIPPKFANIELSTLKPFNQKQSEVLPKMKNNPLANYFFGGRFGTGKTLLMWALYREAVMNDRRVVACTLTELMNEHFKFIQASKNGQELIYPRISAEDLRQTHTKYSIFLDDVDKAKPSEYVSQEIFELADAIYSFGHQIVVTTNLTVIKLKEHFERSDERYGGAIVRRLVDGAEIVEF